MVIHCHKYQTDLASLRNHISKIFIIIKVGEEKYQTIVKELPSFHNGMCYIIECRVPFDPNNPVSIYSMWLTIEKTANIKGINVWMTSQYDYLSITHISRFDHSPFKTTVPFGSPNRPKVLAIENEIQNLNCKTSDPKYLSFEQCLVDLFVSMDSLKCPTKCIPIQMKGFKYINESVNLKDCTKIEDEICIGGPKIWKNLKKLYFKCPMPCKLNSYGLSQVEQVSSVYNDVNQNEAILTIHIMETRKITTEVLLYDTNDMIGAIGGSLGLFLGFSFFQSLSKCVEKIFEIFLRNH